MPTRPYSVVLTASVTSNGSTVTAKFVNEDSHQSLGSADLTAPEGYIVSSATVSQGSASVSGNVVELRNLALQAGASLTATIDVSSTTCASSTWAVEAKQSQQFQGVRSHLHARYGAQQPQYLRVRSALQEGRDLHHERRQCKRQRTGLAEQVDEQGAAL